MNYFMNYFAPVIGLIMIFALLIGATLKINTLMIGNKINFLENKKVTFRIALILISLYISAIIFGYFEGFVYYWYDYLSFSFSIALIFAAGKYTPGLIIYLRELHQSNLEDAKGHELQDSE
jgi:hypothetical protein